MTETDHRLFTIPPPDVAPSKYSCVAAQEHDISLLGILVLQIEQLSSHGLGTVL